MVENATMVDPTPESDSDISHQNISKSRHFKIKPQAKHSTSSTREDKSHGGSFVYRSFRKQGFSRDVSETLTMARGETTYSQYQVYFEKWKSYCYQRDINPNHPDLNDCLQFLVEFKSKVGYSSIATAKAALNSFVKIDGKPLGLHPLTTLFMRGIARQLPRAPKYDSIWDPELVVKFLRTWSPARALNLLQLSVKTVTLIMLVTSQRPQILKHLSLDNMVQKQNSITFTITENLKQSRGNSPATTIQLKAHPDKRVCVVNYLKFYLTKTAPLRSDRQIFLATTKPHQAATLSTMSRWVKIGLQKSGIDTKIFAPGSTRAAASNAAINKGVPLQTVLKQATWQNKSTFTKWYKKPVQKQVSFQSAVLKKSKSSK